MMQIFVNAIEKSRTDNTQYVLFKSLDMLCVSDKVALLELLQDGWQIMGEYHNGVEYERFKLTSVYETTSVNHFIHEEILNKRKRNYSVDIIYLLFQEFFQPKTCKSEGLNVHISFWKRIETQNGQKIARDDMKFEDKDARKIRDFLVALRCKQDNDTLIDLIQKKLNEVNPQC